MTYPLKPVLQDHEEQARILLSAPGMSTGAGALALAILNGDIAMTPEPHHHDE